MIRTLSLFAAVCGLAIAQCTIPPDIGRLNLEQVRSRISAGRGDFALYKHLLDLTPMRPKPGSLAPAFRQRLYYHPDDARFVYLYGRALIGRDTPAAILQLQRAAALDPKFPWTYAALAEVYASPNFKDDQRLLTAMSQFRDLCPATLEGFRYLNHVKEAREAGAWASRLRALLEQRSEAEDATYWPWLWGAEFRAAPESEYPEMRKRVAADIGRLESLPDHDSESWRAALMNGYQLTGQTEAAAKIQGEFDGIDSPVLRELRAWETSHGSRTRNRTRQEHEQLMREEAEFAAEWVRKWPLSVFAWSTRLRTLPFASNWTKDDMERVGERVIELDRRRDIGWTYIPEKLRVAEVWIRYGVQLKASLAMAEEALAEIALGPEEVSDLTATSNAVRAAASGRFGFDSSTWDAMGAVLDASLQLNDAPKARSMLAGMKQWLDENQDRRSDPASGYDSFQGRRNMCRGKVAEAEGHRLDALAFYAKAISAGSYRDYEADHARTLWQEQGGTTEAWDSLTARPYRPKPAPTKTAATTPVVRPFAAFADLGKPLPELNLRDLAGNVWTLDKFKGKRTFVNVWATWCPPCRQEFPSVQKLYDLAKGRDDLQIVTLNVDDENPGLVAPFLSANNATLPVLIGARTYVTDLIGMLGLPQNWLVDRNGILRRKAHGFDDSLQDWPARMLEQLQQLP